MTESMLFGSAADLHRILVPDSPNETVKMLKFGNCGEIKNIPGYMIFSNFNGLIQTIPSPH